ncbi:MULTISPECIES: hypothetical protein [Streptomyces]|uniref:hypothetical protein n=1 Tax=Streptomyces TaxID=1883 RepID=UPI000A3DC08B|nr:MULTISPECIES: hypothetical protein [Streptomyces]
MQADTRSWAARWSFTTASGVTTGTARATSFQKLASTVSKAAERSLANLTEDEGDALDGRWNRFLARLELLAERQAAAPEAGTTPPTDGPTSRSPTSPTTRAAGSRPP